MLLIFNHCSLLYAISINILIKYINIVKPSTYTPIANLKASYNNTTVLKITKFISECHETRVIFILEILSKKVVKLFYSEHRTHGVIYLLNRIESTTFVQQLFSICLRLP